MSFVVTGLAGQPAPFNSPQRVLIEGYDGDAMEPALSRDGRILFFHNLNDPKVDTNLYWAERIDDLHFQFRGEVGGVNSIALDAVASMDRNNQFYFVTTRSGTGFVRDTEAARLMQRVNSKALEYAPAISASASSCISRGCRADA